MNKKGTRFFRPTSINQLNEIALKEPNITLLAGGTSLFRTINGKNLYIPGVIIIMDDIVELKKENRTERYFEFGSMLTINQIIDSSKRNIPKVLLQGFTSMAPFPIRNIATIGGSIANKEIIADIIPLLIILNTKVEVLSFTHKKKKSSKWESITQYLSTKEKRSFHLITRIRIPLTNPTSSIYYKTNVGFDLFKELTFSAILELEKESISSISMAFNIENKFIIRTKEIEEILMGKRVPIAHRNRNGVMSAIKLSLSQHPELNERHIYQMSHIILNFLESL